MKSSLTQEALGRDLLPHPRPALMAQRPQCSEFSKSAFFPQGPQDWATVPPPALQLAAQCLGGSCGKFRLGQGASSSRAGGDGQTLPVPDSSQLRSTVQAPCFSPVSTTMTHRTVRKEAA